MEAVQFIFSKNYFQIEREEFGKVTRKTIIPYDAIVCLETYPRFAVGEFVHMLFVLYTSNTSHSFIFRSTMRYEGIFDLRIKSLEINILERNPEIDNRRLNALQFDITPATGSEEICP